MMRHIFLGFVWGLLAAIGFSLLASLFICLGVDSEARSVSDAVCPVLGLLIGAYFAARGASSWKAGADVALVYVILWIGFWLYVMGRWSPALWMEEALPRLTIAHVLWWGFAIVVGIGGGMMRRVPLVWFGGIVAGLCVVSLVPMTFVKPTAKISEGGAEAISGYRIERQGPSSDGTVFYLLTFDSQKQADFSVGLYDCDSDDVGPYDDSNTSYMGQSIGGLVDKLGIRAEPARRRILCALNGGFFGASSYGVAHHEEPMVEMGRVHYNVDLLRPRDQSCFFAVNSTARVREGKPRYALLQDMPSGSKSDYQTVLGGVRPLRVDGKSVQLKPGAGATTLRCSRTSLGWSADGNTLYVLVVLDPDGELASQIQRNWNFTQTGGWDVREVQHYWEEKQVPSAVLFDGGESTQLAFRQPDDSYHFVASGYQYSFTLGYLLQRPLRFTLPILPPSEAHRGVLNYLYVDGPAGL
jgi:Phosphodiester glycosidase